MKVCSSCFSDKELTAFILTSNDVGNCSICHSVSQHLLDISELYDFFQELINHFRIDSNGTSLASKLQLDWSFFKSQKIAKKILDFVIKKIQTKIPSANTLVNYSEEILKNFGHWDTLKDELKWKNRFIIDIPRLGKDEFNWDAFLIDSNTLFNLTNQTKLFRARIHIKSGMPVFPPNEMSCPPKEIASSGRANPMGIPFLYLSEDKSTVLYEVRASYLDEISIGVFQLKGNVESVSVVDFTKNSSLFQPDNTRIAIQGKLLRDRISKDLSKPMRRYDSELEYIPTQFICEYIKVFTGAKGIRFKSSLNPKGNNIVFFEPELMNCVSAKKIQITNIKLESKELA
jgi:hypothetical protein